MRKKIFTWALMIFVIMCSSAWAGIKIDAANFPDPMFRKYISNCEAESGNCNGELDDRELSKWTSLMGPSYHNTDERIKDLKGIEFFHALEYIDISGTFTNVDLSNNTKLKRLYIGGPFTSINLDNNKELEVIYFYGDSLTSLSLNLPKLRSLDCSRNKITSLNVSGCKALEFLYCYDNPLGSLSLSGLSSLRILDCSKTKLTSLSIKGCSSITDLSCNSSNLTTLDVSGSKTLEILSCGANKLTELNASGCTALKSLFCSGNQIKKLNLSGCTALTAINHKPYIVDNPLEVLDVSKCTNLRELTFYEMPLLKEIDVSGCTSLSTLKCHKDDIQELILDDSNPNLYNLHCYGNKMTYLDLSKLVNPLNIYDVKISPQEVSRDLKVKKIDKQLFQIDFKDIMPAKYVKNVLPESITVNADNFYYPHITSYDVESGIATFNFVPFPPLEYVYNTCSPGKSEQMQVKVNYKDPEVSLDPLELKVEVLGSNKGDIISYIENGNYYNKDGKILDEKALSKLNGAYEASGFTADGNSRLIVRVQANKEGSGYLTVKGRNNSIYSDYSLKSEEIDEDKWQASTFLTAPENFPQGSNFPSDTFSVNVKYTANDGTSEEKDVELRIESTPVILIHGFGQSAAKTFGSGILYVLRNARFDVSCWNYDSLQGPKTVLANDYNELFKAVTKKFDEYAARKIVCTKVDFVGFGMGGLMARKFLEDKGKEKDDGNNWTIRSYKNGMVRRLITVATPHYGTPWADILLNPNEALLNLGNSTDNEQMKTFLLLMQATLPTNLILLGTGITELMTSSSARDYGFPSNVPMHAIYSDVLEALRVNLFYDLLVKVIEAKTGAVIDLRDIPSTSLFFAPYILKKYGGKIGAKFIPFIGVIATIKDGADLLIKGPSFLRNCYSAFIFGNQEHDLFVSGSSAVAGLSSTKFQATKYEDLDKYSHFNLGRNFDVGVEVASLLMGPVSDYYTSKNNKNSVKHNVKNSAPVVSSSSKNATSTEKFTFTENIKLKITPSIFKISGSKTQSIKITATTENPMEHDIFCVIGDERNNGRLLILPSSDNTGKNFEKEVIFTNEDFGNYEIVCYSHNPNAVGTGIFSSNVEKLSVIANLDSKKFTEAGFFGNTTIYTNVNSGVSAEFCAITEDGNVYDVSSPLAGTKWTIKNPEIASVNDNGEVQGLKEGTTTITATFRGFSASINVEVEPAFEDFPEITTETLPNGKVNSSYSKKLTATGRTPITWKIVEGNLPDNLKLTNGTIKGVPAKSGTFTFTVRASNDTGYYDEKTLSLEIDNKYSNTAINASVFPDENFRNYVSNNFDKNKDGLLSSEEIDAATEIDVSYTSQITSLKGLQCFSKLKKLICSYNNELKTLDVSENTLLTELRCSVNGLTELNLSENIELETLECNYNSLKSLILDNNTKIHSLYFSNNSFAALDISKCGLWNLYCENQNIEKIEIGSVNDSAYPYQLIFSNIGVTSADYSKILNISATDEAGKSIKTSYNKTNGIVKFVSRPSRVIYDFSLNYQKLVWDSSIGGARREPDTQIMNVTLNIVPEVKLSISGTMTTTGTIGKKYTGNLTVDGGTSYKWKKSGGTLPTGLKLSSTTKNKVVLSGTPEEAGKFTFTLKVTDTSGTTASKKCTVTIAEKPIISGDIKANGVIKKSYSSSVNFSGGTKPYTWIYSGTLPKGLELVQNSTGTKLTIKGIPTTAKVYNFTLKVTDKHGATASKKFTVTITKPVISGDIKANGVVKKSYSSSLTISGGTSPYTWVKSSGTLPKGLELVQNSTGTKLTLKGTPTTAKEYTFTLKATDNNGATASKKFIITVTKTTINGALTSTGTLKKSYSSSLTVNGGSSPYNWSVSKGTLPAGLKLVQNSTGTKLTIKGTPTTAKAYTFTLKVTDKNASAASKQFKITIAKATTKTTQTEKTFDYNNDINYLQNQNFVVPDTETDFVNGEKSFINLKVLSEDILWQGKGKDEDLIGVRANKALNFVIENVPSDMKIVIDDKPFDEIEIFVNFDEGSFTIPAEFVSDDFKVRAENDKIKTNEIFISVEKELQI